MSESFGARLRRRREEQHIALATIAEQTKIKQSLLEALERDDVSHWPSGIFRRAFVRAYAHAINLEPDAVVHDFFEAFPEPAEVVTPAALAAAADAARGTGASSNRLRSLLHSAVESLSRLQWQPEVSIAPGEVSAPNMPEAASMVALQDQREKADAAVEQYLPRGLSRMEQALDLISASARSQAPDDSNPDFVALAQVCTDLARVDNPGDVRPLLRKAATILNAIGVVLWVWDHLNVELRPAVACGYSDPLAQLPNVSRDADNVTAVALRSGQPCSIEDNDRSALALPLLTPAGCAGVLAFELPGSAPTALVRAAATFVAAQLSQLLGGAEASEVQLPPVSVAVAHSQLAS